MNGWVRLGMWLAGALLAAGCALEPSGGLPKLRYGQVMCGECGMLISEARFAAAARTAAGEIMGFDDIGCLLRRVSREDAAGWQLWVPTEPDGAWTEARAAWYVRQDGLTTPMGYGLTALNRTDAPRAGAAISFAAATAEVLAALPQPQGGSP